MSTSYTKRRGVGKGRNYDIAGLHYDTPGVLYNYWEQGTPYTGRNKPTTSYTGRYNYLTTETGVLLTTESGVDILASGPQTTTYTGRTKP